MKTSAAARALSAAVRRIDELHPVALLALIVVFVALAYVAAPFLLALLVALVAVIKAAVFLAGAALLVRLAIRAASSYGPRKTP